MPPVGFEPTISAGERVQTYTLDRAATGTGFFFLYPTQIIVLKMFLFFYLPLFNPLAKIISYAEKIGGVFSPFQLHLSCFSDTVQSNSRKVFLADTVGKVKALFYFSKKEQCPKT